MKHIGSSLQHDLPDMLRMQPQRRRILRMLSLGALAPWALATYKNAEAVNASCSVIPSETAGPFPGDGTNRNADGIANVLQQSGVMRSDIRASFAGMNGTATGALLHVRLKLVNSKANCASLAGRAIYIWHCTRDGAYSLYSTGVSRQNFLRGVQVTDANGEAGFVTIFPGCYPGRWPHIHFEIFNDIATATSGRNDIKTSQLALPADMCAQVYAGAGYEANAVHFSRMSIEDDGIFGADSAAQMAQVSGDGTRGYTAALTLGLAL
jgi:protocatechuate 3,4-dioxygenase beta subunit